MIDTAKPLEAAQPVRLWSIPPALLMTRRRYIRYPLSAADTVPATYFVAFNYNI
jgi:hypothetical protein